MDVAVPTGRGTAVVPVPGWSGVGPVRVVVVRVVVVRVVVVRVVVVRGAIERGDPAVFRGRGHSGQSGESRQGEQDEDE